MRVSRGLRPTMERLKFGYILTQPSPIVRIKEAQEQASIVKNRQKKAKKGELPNFRIGPEGVLTSKIRYMCLDIIILKRKYMKRHIE